MSLSLYRVSIFGLIAATALSSACVISPLDNSEQVNPITVSGYAGGPGAIVRIQAYNYTTLEWDDIATTSTSRGAANYGQSFLLYDYSTTVTVADEYWQLGCGSEQARMRALDRGQVLRSFNSDGMDCLTDALGQGDEWMEAGNACATGRVFRVTRPASPC